MLQRKTSDIFNFCIIVPFYNEEQTIYPICARLLETGYPILFVDDGSTDRSLAILLDIWEKTGKSFNIVRNEFNEGKGSAIKKGAKYAIKMGYDYMMFVDSDGQNDIGDIEKFKIIAEREPEAKIIIGNRLFNPKGMPKIRYAVNRIMSWIISKLAHQHIADSQCGMRLIHKDVFAHKLASDRFELESEMLVKAGRAGMKIINCPITCIYKKGRESKINPLPDMIRFFKMLFKLF